MGTGERGLWGDGPALTGSGLVMEGILLLPREKNQLWGQCKGMQNAGLHESTGVQELWRRRPAPQRAKGWGGPAVKGVVELAETDHPGNGGAGGGKCVSGENGWPGLSRRLLCSGGAAM